jgi:hypothetical protein
MIEKNIKLFTAIVFVIVLLLAKEIIGPVTCSSGWQSASIGRQGACSHHGGVAGWKGFMPFVLGGVAALWFYGTFSASNTSSANQNKRTSQAPSASNKLREAQSHVVRCPRCNGPMSLKIARKGKNAGGKFWGCNKYPRCKGIRSYQ